MGQGRRNYFEVSLSFKEIIFYLFGRKRCPNCNRKLKRVYKTSYTGVGKRNNSSLTSAYIEYDINNVKILYECSNCNLLVPISELCK